MKIRFVVFSTSSGCGKETAPKTSLNPELPLFLLGGVCVGWGGGGGLSSSHVTSLPSSPLQGPSSLLTWFIGIKSHHLI